MSHLRFSRWLVVAAAVGCTAFGVPSAVAEESPSSVASPIGVFPGIVSRPGATDPITLTFQSTGTACLRTAVGLSVGTWYATGSNTFDYHIKEAMIGAGGTQIGWIYVNQQAVLNSQSFVSYGVSKITDMYGNDKGSSAATVTASRDVAASPC